MPYLVNTKKYLAPELPEAPLIVFINSKSGGHAGPQLTEVLYHTLGHAQVNPFLRTYRRMLPRHENCFGMQISFIMQSHTNAGEGSPTSMTSCSCCAGVRPSGVQARASAAEDLEEL